MVDYFEMQTKKLMRLCKAVNKTAYTFDRFLLKHTCLHCKFETGIEDWPHTPKHTTGCIVTLANGVLEEIDMKKSIQDDVVVS